MESRYGQTSFRDYSHAQLVAMLQAGKVPETIAMGGRWRDIANWLDGMAVTLEHLHRTAADLWEGPAAQAHEQMVATLIDCLHQVAFTARRLADQVVTAAEALRRAQERMASLPPPIDLQPPDESVLIAASTRVRDERWAESAARQAQAMRAIQEFRRAQAAAATVTVAAVQIMEELRDAYRNIDLPRPPGVEEPPTIGPDGQPVFAVVPTGGQSRLLNDLWRNGLIATAGIPPAQVLPTIGTGGNPPPVETFVAPPPTAPPATIPDLGSGGMGGLGPVPSFGGGELAPLPSLDVPVDSPPAPAVGTASVTPGGHGPKGPVASPVAGGMPFFPPMMGGMVPPTHGAGDLSRSDKPWLAGEFEGAKGVILEIVQDSIET